MCSVWFSHDKQESMLVVLMLKLLDNICWNVFVYSPCLFGSFSIVGWDSYEDMLLLLMSIRFTMMCRCCFIAFPIQNSEFHMSQLCCWLNLWTDVYRAVAPRFSLLIWYFAETIWRLILCINGWRTVWFKLW